MKILRKVSAKEVKRTFVIANDIRLGKNGRRFLGKVSKDEFLRKLMQSKRRGLRMTEKQLDAHISPDWPPRLKAYDDSDWYLAEVRPSEAGVWKRAGDLPHTWTNRSLKETSDHVRFALNSKSRHLAKRAKRAISNMLATNISLLQGEKYLLPIAFKAGTGTPGRRGLKHPLKVDIDDGCMRSIALAVNGSKTIKLYVGMPKRKRN